MATLEYRPRSSSSVVLTALTIIAAFVVASFVVGPTLAQPNPLNVSSGSSATYAVSPSTFLRGGAGNLDASFGANGIALLPEGPGTPGPDLPEESGLALQADGKILTAGHENADGAVFRMNPDGTLDEGFGTGGVATADFGSALDYFYSVAVQPDGKIVAAGSIRLEEIGNGDGAVLARFLPDGTLDEAFGKGGLVFEPGTPESDTPDAFWHVAVRPDGRIITAGVRGAFWSLGAERYACYAAQYLADGSRDPAFGSGGLVRVAPEEDLLCLDGDLADDGSYVLGIVMDDDTPGPPSRWAAARVLPDGTLDDTFGDGGLALTEPVFSLNQGVVVGPDGSVTLGGWGIPGQPTSGASLVRFTNAGEPDVYFGTDAGVDGHLDLFATSDITQVHELAFQPDGKLLLTGVGDLDVGVGALLMRLLPDGSFDPTFGNTTAEGITFIDVSDVSDGFGIGYDVGLDAEGRVLVSGDANFNATTRRGYVARFENDLTVSAESGPQSQQPTLHAPFPNPMRQMAALRYTLAESSRARLTLFDLLGREVAVLAESTLPAGTYEVPFDTGRLAPGIYVARLTVGEETVTRRITVIR